MNHISLQEYILRMGDDERRQLRELFLSSDVDARDRFLELLVLSEDAIRDRINATNAQLIQTQLSQRVPLFTKHPEILDNLRALTPSGKLIEGLVQSGKTPVICGLAVFCIQVLNVPVVVLVRNFNADKEQLMRKFKPGGQFADLLGMDRVCDASNRDIRNRSDLFDTPRLILCLENHTPLRRIVELHREQPFCLIVDEADHVAYKSRPQISHTWFQQLRARALHFVAVTATVFDVLYLDSQITNRDIHRIPPPSDYRGFGSDAFKIIGLPDAFHFGLTADGTFSSDLERFYLEILGTMPYPDCVYEAEDRPRTLHPVICLQKIGTVVKEQLRFMDALGRHPVLGREFAVITFNGEGVYAYCPRGQLPLRIGDAIGEPYTGMRRNKRLRAESANVPVETDIVAYSQLNIPKMLQYFRDNQTIHRVTHIVIIAGKIADRGLNIVSTDYRWHLTHEILSPSKTAVVTELVQSGGRLCGVMDDHLESYLYVTQKDKEDLERGTTLQDQVLTEAQTHPETVLMQAFCEQVPLTRDMIPKRRTTRKRRVEPNWNYTEEKKEDENDAHYLDQFCSNLRRQIEQNEETVVRRVLRFMIAHSGSHLRNDIERTCNARDFRDITQWGGHRYYKILVRSGDRWKLNPSVVDRLTREQLMDRV